MATRRQASRPPIERAGLVRLALLGAGQLVALVALFASGGFLDWYPSRLGATAIWIDDHLLSIGRPALDASVGGSQLAAAATYTVSLVISFALYGLGISLALRIGAGSVRHLAVVILFSTLAAVCLLWQPVLSSQDIFSYALYSRIWAIYGGNPLIETPRDYPFDPLFGAVFWKDQPSNYGPLWTYLSGIAARLGASSVAETLIYHKALAALSVLLGTPLLWSALGRIAPERRLSGTLLFGWNPLLAFETFGNGHNDAVMAFFVLLGIWLASRRRRYLAIAAFTASALVKYVSLVVVPLYLVALLREEPDWRSRLSLAVRAGMVGAALCVVAFLPVYSGPSTLQVLAFGSTPLAYTNTPLEIAFRELRVALGESREAAGLPLRHRAWWAEARSPTVFWTKLNRPDATGLSLADGDPILVVEPQLLRWFHVYEPSSGLFGYVPASDVVRAPPPPAGYLAGRAAATLEDLTRNPMTQQANFTLRMLGMLIFAGIYIGLLVRVAMGQRGGPDDARAVLTDVAWTSLAALLASYWFIEMWFWPWYLIWALPFAALVPRRSLSQALLAFTMTSLILNVQASLDIAPFLAPLYEYRSVLVFGLPIAWAVLRARRSHATGAGAPARLPWLRSTRSPRPLGDDSQADRQQSVAQPDRSSPRAPSLRAAPVMLAVTAALIVAAVASVARQVSPPADVELMATTSQGGGSTRLAWNLAYETALDRIAERRFAEAELALTGAISLHPDAPEAYRARAEVHFRLEQWSLAIKDLTRVIELEGESAEVLLRRGDAWLHRQRFDLAIADYSAAARLEPHGHLAYAHWAVALHATGDLADARGKLGAALALYPNDAEANRLLGDVLAAGGDWEGATLAYDRAVALDHSLATAYVGRAVVTRHSRKYFQTIPDLEQVLVLSPDLNEQEWARQQLRSLAEQTPGHSPRP